MRPAYFSYSFLLSFIATVLALRWFNQIIGVHELWFGLFAVGSVSILIKRLRLITAATLGVAVASLVVQQHTHLPHPGTVDWYANEQNVEISGTITAEPDRRPLVHKYTITVDSLTTSGITINGLNGQVLASDRRLYPRFEYGDRVTVYGKLEKPGQIERFAYDKYLSRYGIYSVMYRANINGVTLSVDEGPTPLRHLFVLKESFEKRINQLYPEPHASFMAGLLTGSRKGIPTHLLDDFNATGLTHIIAISGYNITIIIVIFSGLLFWLPLKWRFVPLISAIILFTIFVGASAAVVRASIMGILGLIALQVGRLSEVRLTILWTLFLMLVWNPKYLWYDAGFQLSFLAVLGLTEVAPHLERWFKKIPQTLGLREALMMTIAAQITAVPLIVLLFQRLSLIAPIANVLIAPFVPLAMLFGFTGVIISYAYFPLGLLISYIGWACLQWIVLVAKHLAALPFATVAIPTMNIYLLTIYYLALIFVITRRRALPSLC